MNCPYCNSVFLSWLSVRNHTSKCIHNNHEYHISITYGPIHYSEFTSKIRYKYPHITGVADARKKFRKYNIPLKEVIHIWNKESVKEAILFFEKTNERVPQARDFENNDNYNYPGRETVKDIFGSWNEAIIYSGLKPNYNDGFGNRVVGLDGLLYRSNYEALFANKYLYNKENYIYELKYTNENRFYDFYLPDRDIYIEIDGGLRPEIIKEKIQINKELNRNLIVVKTKDINKFRFE